MDELTPVEQKAVMRKVTLRLIPLLFTCYVIAYIDRINVGFAKLHFREVLGVVDIGNFDRIFGFGAGLFFVGYFIFEVPSNLILQRVGARVWIARIMIVWGFVSMGFMFMNGVNMFYVMRFLLGGRGSWVFSRDLVVFHVLVPGAGTGENYCVIRVGRGGGRSDWIAAVWLDS